MKVRVDRFFTGFLLIKFALVVGLFFIWMAWRICGPWAIPIVFAAFIAFLAWVLCRISGDSDERAERIYQAEARRERVK